MDLDPKNTVLPFYLHLYSLDPVGYIIKLTEDRAAPDACLYLIPLVLCFITALQHKFFIVPSKEGIKECTGDCLALYVSKIILKSLLKCLQDDLLSYPFLNQQILRKCYQMHKLFSVNKKLLSRNSYSDADNQSMDLCRKHDALRAMQVVF